MPSEEYTKIQSIPPVAYYDAEVGRMNNSDDSVNTGSPPVPCADLGTAFNPPRDRTTFPFFSVAFFLIILATLIVFVVSVISANRSPNYEQFYFTLLPLFFLTFLLPSYTFLLCICSAVALPFLSVPIQYLCFAWTVISFFIIAEYKNSPSSSFLLRNFHNSQFSLLTNSPMVFFWSFLSAVFVYVCHFVGTYVLFRMSYYNYDDYDYAGYEVSLYALPVIIFYVAFSYVISVVLAAQYSSNMLTLILCKPPPASYFAPSVDSAGFAGAHSSIPPAYPAYHSTTADQGVYPVSSQHTHVIDVFSLHNIITSAVLDLFSARGPFIRCIILKYGYTYQQARAEYNHVHHVSASKGDRIRLENSNLYFSIWAAVSTIVVLGALLFSYSEKLYYSNYITSRSLAEAYGFAAFIVLWACEVVRSQETAYRMAFTLFPTSYMRSSPAEYTSYITSMSEQTHANIM